MLNEEMPVLFGSKNYYDKRISVFDGRAGKSSTISDAFKQVLPQDCKQDENQQRQPFMKSYFEMSTKTQKGKLGSIVRYDHIFFGMQEFFIQVETTIVNDNLKFML